jgi:hypothetical protein
MNIDLERMYDVTHVEMKDPMTGNLSSRESPPMVVDGYHIAASLRRMNRDIEYLLESKEKFVAHITKLMEEK